MIARTVRPRTSIAWESCFGRLHRAPFHLVREKGVVVELSVDELADHLYQQSNYTHMVGGSQERVVLNVLKVKQAIVSQHIRPLQPPEEEEVPEAFWMLIERCWSPLPDERPTMKQVLQSLCDMLEMDFNEEQETIFEEVDEIPDMEQSVLSVRSSISESGSDGIEYKEWFSVAHHSGIPNVAGDCGISDALILPHGELWVAYASGRIGAYEIDDGVRSAV